MGEKLPNTVLLLDHRVVGLNTSKTSLFSALSSHTLWNHLLLHQCTDSEAPSRPSLAGTQRPLTSHEEYTDPVVGVKAYALARSWPTLPAILPPCNRIGPFRSPFFGLIAAGLPQCLPTSTILAAGILSMQCSITSSAIEEKVRLSEPLAVRSSMARLCPNGRMLDGSANGLQRGVRACHLSAT